MIDYTTTDIQNAVNLFNRGPIPVDGIPGPQTKQGIKGLQEDLAIEADGIWGPITNQQVTTRTLILQIALSESGYPLAIDGIPGPETIGCVKVFQQNHQLTPDGIAGPNTTAALAKEAAVQAFLVQKYDPEDLPNFTENEFKCPCGCGGDITPSMKIHIQKLRDRINMILKDGQDHPLIITSGYRCPAENTAAGGVSDSLHMEGLAVDLYTPGMNENKFNAIINGAHSLGLTCGRYNSSLFVHVQQGSHDFIGD